jgi:hypothetical protein
MKRFVLVLLVVSSFLWVYAQEDDYELSPWSFTAEYGVSNLDGDGDATIHSAFGVSAEYAVFPFAGLSVDYYHFPLGGPTFSTNVNAGGINLMVNVNRLLFSRKDDKVVVKGYLGFGLAGYSSKYSTATAPTSVSVYSVATSFPVLAVSAEYSFLENLSFGLKAQYRPFDRNDLEGDPRFNLDNITNDNLVALTLFLRLKLYTAN